MATLRMDRVAKSYGPVLAISNVSIQVDEGEFLVLVGPSGCGKSTLLRMIAGLETLTEGRVFLGDKDVSNVDPKLRDIAMVFQNYALYPHMTVYENMAFGLQQRKVPKAEIKEKVEEVARILDLTGLTERKPGALSGGQRQRVAMGRAIVRNPAMYLMDEPLSNLDAKLRVQMRAELKLLRAKMGVTTVYVTHDQVEAMTLGDKVAVLKPIERPEESNLQQIDSPHDLYLHPANMFVAGFIGSPAMNFLYADIVQVGEGLGARIADMSSVVELSRARDFDTFPVEKYLGRRIVLGIRPEFFSLSDGSADQSASRLTANILVSELVGPDAYLHFDLPTPEVDMGTDLVFERQETGQTASRFTARVASESLPKEVGEVDLVIDAAKIHFFDPETTLAIA
ncbi:MAG: ATP-binding cassette domain-containing protein [Pseudomonadota bacterium]